MDKNDNTDSTSSDLEKSFTEVLNNTDMLFKNILKIIESSVQDEEIKNSSLEFLKKLYIDFQNQNKYIKISNLNSEKHEEE